MVLIDGDVVVCVYLLQGFQDSIGRIREKMKGKVEITPSAYDTAWVAMVPSREDSGREPLFPQCLDWIIENQNPDGSWGLQHPGHPLLVKDSLSCTLACLVALRKWNAGDQLVKKGLEFLRSNAWAAADNHQISPIGFDIVFPMMINYANDLDLTLPFHQHLLDSMFSNRHSEIKRNPNLEYVAEGLGESFDWNKSLTQQRSNGSLFNSPATTAAAFIHTQDNNCFQYLHSVLITFKTWVPTVYPIDIYARLSMVDTLQRLGVDRYFQSEIDSILEETYRLWQQKEEEIFTDITCCAMAFRLLRIQGYEVSSDELAAFVDQERFFYTVSPQMGGVATVLELYRASQVDYELKNFHGIPDRVGNRRSLELYDMDNYQVLKTAYRCPAIHNEDLFLFSRQDFNICQSQYQKELEQLERWYKDCRLDSLKFGRSVVNISHFLTCAILADPLLSDARLSYAKSIVLVTCLDDFFDHHGSREESFKILELTKQWNEQPATAYGSEEVEILFTALYNTVNEVAAKAYIEQGRCVKHLLVSLWVEMLTSFMREMDSWSDETPPSVDEYLSFAWLSISCRSCILTSIHFLGINLSEDMVTSPEFTSLCMHVSFVARLLNDLQTFKKEEEERKLNSVILMQAAHKDGGGISEGDAIWEIKKIVEFNRRKLLQMVYQRNGSIVPKECKDIFWRTSKIAYYLYSSGDEFTSPQEMMEDMKSLIYKPLELPAHATS
ncbi:UNVERIFIED_CONTAM: Cis-abienol synthase, chloroplastic [Sesamum angustifolium]|uniref:Cis-abienol synthase, chloroplastic n=1 Tax=Sesamum angustifolium TaxID=2727405 RepID=A0AAW2MIB7_9LAMI